MNFFKTIGFLSLLVTLLFTSCRKDDETFGVFPPDTVGPEVIVNGSLSGVVKDENDAVVQDALVSLGSNTTMTDENGYFSFQNVEINTKGSLVQVQKFGYFYHAKFVDSELNKQNFTSIKLIEKVETGTFQANAGGTITSNGGASIEFAANSIKQEGGGAYLGNVNVYATWLDPTATDLAQRMPGDLRATNLAGERQQLTTFGMIGVELEGDTGEMLNIAEGQTATISLPVPAELTASAPATIPLWHLDESTGYWIEEGEAILQDGKYVGTVSHFSFWNCDVPNDFIQLEGIVNDRAGNPLQNLEVLVTELSSGLSGYDFTNADGFFSGFVPNDQELSIFITDNCGNEVYSATIGPFSMDEVLDTIFVAPVYNFVNISGTLMDCDNRRYWSVKSWSSMRSFLLEV